MMTFLGATLLCRRTCVFFSQLNWCDHTYRNSLSFSFLFLSHFFHSCISSHLNPILIPFFHSTLLSYLDVIYHHLTFILSSSHPSSRLSQVVVAQLQSAVYRSLCPQLLQATTVSQTDKIEMYICVRVYLCIDVCIHSMCVCQWLCVCYYWILECSSVCLYGYVDAWVSLGVCEISPSTSIWISPRIPHIRSEDPLHLLPPN